MLDMISLISCSLLLLSFVKNVSSRPSSYLECRPGEFYDENVFDWHSCSVCFTKDGQMFDKQCKLCNCTAIETTSNRMVTTTQTPLNESTTSSTPNQTYQATFIPEIPTTSVQSRGSYEINQKNSNDFHIYIITFCIVLSLVILGLVILFLCKRQTSLTNVKGCNCYKYAATKKSTECHEDMKNTQSQEHSGAIGCPSSHEPGSFNPSFKGPMSYFDDNGLKLPRNDNNVRISNV